MRSLVFHSFPRGILLMDVLEVLEIVEGEISRIVEGQRDMMLHAQSLAGDKGVCGSQSPLTWSSWT